MGMPTEEELKIALAEAARMREQGEDPHFLAKSLLNYTYQVEQLKKVLKAADLFYHSGMAVQEQTNLKRAIEQVKENITRTSGDEEEYWLMR